MCCKAQMPGFPALSEQRLFSVLEEVVIKLLAHLYLTVASWRRHVSIPAFLYCINHLKPVEKLFTAEEERENIKLQTCRFSHCLILSFVLFCFLPEVEKYQNTLWKRCKFAPKD